MIHTGKLIVLAYPDTFVRMSDEWQCKLLPLVGLGTWKQIKAGHAAIILIENNTGNSNYYDFGRYVTPDGFGRVRSAITDDELKIPFKARLIGNGPLENIEEFLLWLDANPQKTHGEGRLLASVCEEVNFEKAKNYILKLQKKGSIPYRAFKNDGSNCARFVTETILASVDKKKIIKTLNRNKRFSPSPIGNVVISASSKVFKTFNGVVEEYTGSALKENLTNYFHRNKSEETKKQTLPSLPKNAQKLSGYGSNAWFEIELLDLEKKQYRIQRFNDLHKIDYVGVFEALDEFDVEKPFQITYDSHCDFCHVMQLGNKIKLQKMMTCPTLNLIQQVASA